MNFADKYAEASLAPSGELIERRQASLAKAPKDLSHVQILGLCRFYFGLDGADVDWLVDLLRADDASYSLLANRRETTVLAAEVLSQRIAAGSSFDLLAILVTSAMGIRTPEAAGWLLAEARQQILDRAAGARRMPARSAITRPSASRLAEEIKAAEDDWEAQRVNLGKVRAEALAWSTQLANQTAAATAQIQDRLQLLQEETNILWWLFGETSHFLGEPYSALASGPADLVVGFDLAALTTSTLGPVAVEAMMSRMVRLAKKTRGKGTLTTLVEGLEDQQVARLDLKRLGEHDDVFIMHAALEMAAEIGRGSWQSAFQKRTGFDPELMVDLPAVRLHAYREYLLARLSLQ